MRINFLISAMSLNEAQIKSIKEKNIWNEDCPVHYSDLTLQKIPYINFDGFSQIGELLIARQVVEKVTLIFEELYHIKFPIHQIKLIDEFDGNDIRSMEANNSSAFNGRRVMNTSKWSSHAYGVAIDINPEQNPYMALDHETSSIQVYPRKGLSYVNRGVKKPGMVEEIVPIFSKYGFSEWGGNWEQKPDYHHFQIPWDQIKQMFPNPPNKV